MKKKTNRIFALILAVLAVAACVFSLSAGKNSSVVTIRCYEGTPIYDYASENGYDIYPIYHYNPIDFQAQEEEFTFKSGLNGVEITGYTGASKDVFLPETLGGSPVVSVAKDAFAGKDVNTIYVPESITAMHCEFSFALYDSDVKFAVFFAVLHALLALIFLLYDAGTERNTAVFGLRFAPLCFGAAALSVLLAPAAALFRLQPGIVLLIGAVITVVLPVSFFIARRGSAGDEPEEEDAPEDEQED